MCRWEGSPNGAGTAEPGLALELGLCPWIQRPCLDPALAGPCLGRGSPPGSIARPAPQEQAAWVCRCEARVVQRLEQDFKATLGQQHSLEQWAAWLDAVVGRVLRPHLGTPGLPRAAKLFLLKWSFYR